MRKRSVERDYSEQKMLACAHERLVHGAEVASQDEVIRALVNAVSLPQMQQPAAAVREVFEKSLCRLSFDRLLHLLDLVLPQMTPILDRCPGRGKGRLQWNIARLRDEDCELRTFGGNWAKDIWFTIRFQFCSHSGIVHLSAVWNAPLLLFMDKDDIPELKGPDVYRDSQVLDNYRRDLQLGLRVGQAILIQYNYKEQN